MIFYTWQIFYSSSSYQNHTMFLQGMLFTRNISNHLRTIGKSYLSNLSLRRVWFFGSSNSHLKTHTSLKWSRHMHRLITLERIDSILQRRSLWFFYFWSSSLFNKLCNSWHTKTLKVKKDQDFTAYLWRTSSPYQKHIPKCITKHTGNASKKSRKLMKRRQKIMIYHDDKKYDKI